MTMFQRTRKPSPMARIDAGDPASLRVRHLLEWRDAAKRVRRTYTAWCAAGRRDRRRLYLSFLDALGREELAARQLESDASSLGAADAAS